MSDAWAQISTPNPSRLNHYIASCMRTIIQHKYLKPDNKGNLPEVKDGYEVLELIKGQQQAMGDLGSACIAYAHLMVDIDKDYVDIPSSQDVSNLTNALVSGQKAMAEKFQFNFVYALACSFATDEAARKKACEALN